jgi:hypothetical protein
MQRPEIGSSVYSLYQANLPRTENRNVIKGDRKINQKREGQNACNRWRNKVFSSRTEGE